MRDRTLKTLKAFKEKHVLRETFNFQWPITAPDQSPQLLSSYFSQHSIASTQFNIWLMIFKKNPPKTQLKTYLFFFWLV